VVEEAWVVGEEDDHVVVSAAAEPVQDFNVAVACADEVYFVEDDDGFFGVAGAEFFKEFVK